MIDRTMKLPMAQIVVATWSLVLCPLFWPMPASGQRMQFLETVQTLSRISSTVFYSAECRVPQSGLVVHDNVNQASQFILSDPNAPAIPEDPIDPNQPAVPGCQIVVTVVNEPEPGGAYIVDGGGNVFIHIAESATPVNIKDQTTTQAAATIATFLKKFMRDPKVTVTIVSVPRPIVYVSGAVHFTGPVQVNKSTTLIDVLSRSDVLDTADLSQVRVTRTQTVGGAEKKLAMALHVDTYMKPERGKELDDSQNPTLQDKDRIFVPFKALVGNGGITIAGEVNHPTQGLSPHVTRLFELLPSNGNVNHSPQGLSPLPTTPMTLREAISLAGRVTSRANRKGVSVRHANGQLVTVDLDKADQDDPANNLVLQPGDVIYVAKLPLSRSDPPTEPYRLQLLMQGLSIFARLFGL